MRHLALLGFAVAGALPGVQPVETACDDAASWECAETSGLQMLQIGLATAPLKSQAQQYHLLSERHRHSLAGSVAPIFSCAWVLLAFISLCYYLFDQQTDHESHDTEEKEEGSSPQRHASSAQSPQRRRSTSEERTPKADAAPPGGQKLLMRRATITVGEIKKLPLYLKTWTTEDAIGTLSGGNFIITMACDIGPNGIVPLPHGLVNTGLIPGMILLIVFYALCSCTMWMIARTALITGKTTFAEQWAKLIGEGSSWIPTAVLIAVCFGNTIEYLCFVADLLAGSLPAFGLPLSRTLCTWLFALFPTLPLCFLKDLSALAPTSLLGLFSVIYLVIVIVLRSFDGSYAPGGHFYVELPVASKPSVPQGHLFQFGLPSLVLINALAMGFLPHYNGCKYYRELEDHNPKRFLKCTMAGMGAAALLYSIAMLAGYRSFGSATQSVITESYSSDDLLINIARVAIGSSILFSFPIMFSGLREAFLQMLSDVGKIECKEVWKQDSITFVMVVLIAFLTSILTDAGLVVGLVGPICGCAAIFLVPCTLYAAALKWRVSHLTADGHASREASDKNMSGQIFLARALTVLGVFLMVGGVYATFAYPG